MEQTPKANRVHIGFFGRCNAGKSTLINMLTDQPVSLVSEVAGTTTDPVSKSMEILPLGPVVITDTAGIDDTSELGALRIEKSEEELEQLEATKQDIMNRTEYIKHELKQLLENQINMIDNIDTGGVHHVGHIIDDLLTMSHERIDGVGRILTNEDPIPVNTLQNEKSKVAYLTPETNVAIDMKEPPVFTMDSF